MEIEEQEPISVDSDILVKLQDLFIDELQSEKNRNFFGAMICDPEKKTFPNGSFMVQVFLENSVAILDISKRKNNVTFFQNNGQEINSINCVIILKKLDQSELKTLLITEKIKRFQHVGQHFKSQIVYRNDFFININELENFSFSEKILQIINNIEVYHSISPEIEKIISLIKEQSANIFKVELGKSFQYGESMEFIRMIEFRENHYFAVGCFGQSYSKTRKDIVGYFGVLNRFYIVYDKNNLKYQIICKANNLTKNDSNSKKYSTYKTKLFSKDLQNSKLKLRISNLLFKAYAIKPD
jgi:hypothetical protein